MVLEVMVDNGYLWLVLAVVVSGGNIPFRLLVFLFYFFLLLSTFVLGFNLEDIMHARMDGMDGWTSG